MSQSLPSLGEMEMQVCVSRTSQRPVVRTTVLNGILAHH